MEKKEFLYIDMMTSYKSNRMDIDEYVLIIQEGNDELTRKAVLLHTKRYRRFLSKMKYYKKYGWS